MDLTFGLKIGHVLEVWRPKLGGFFHELDWQYIAGLWCHITATSFTHMLDLGPTIDLLGSNNSLLSSNRIARSRSFFGLGPLTHVGVN